MTDDLTRALLDIGADHEDHRLRVLRTEDDPEVGPGEWLLVCDTCDESPPLLDFAALAARSEPVCTCGPWKVGQPWGHLPGCPRERDAEGRYRSEPRAEGLRVLDWSYGKTPTYDVPGHCLTCGATFSVRREKGMKPPLNVECPDCKCTEYSWRIYPLAATPPAPALHPDDGHDHRWGCRLCGVDEPPAPALDVALEAEWYNGNLGEAAYLRLCKAAGVKRYPSSAPEQPE